MTAEAGRSPLAARRSSVSPLSRIFGFGSVYAKSLRDGRLSFILIAGLLGGLMLVGGEAFGKAYATPESRKELHSLIESMPPILTALTGNPVNVEVLGGSISWKYGPFFVLLAGLWSILAMSGTLAVEARRGSLDFIAAGPFGKRRIALEKLGAYLTTMLGVMAVLALTAWLDGVVFYSLPGDAISVPSAVGFALWVGLLGIVSGSVAFALAPFIGRGGAAALAGLVMVLGFLLNGYQGAVPAFSSVAWLSWFSWASQMPVANNSCCSSVSRLKRAQSSRSCFMLSCATSAMCLRLSIGMIADFRFMGFRPPGRARGRACRADYTPGGPAAGRRGGGDRRQVHAGT